MIGLRQFLAAQLDAEESTAGEATPSPWRWVDPGDKRDKNALVSGGWRPDGYLRILTAKGEALSRFDADHIAHWGPARAQRYVAAMRAVLAEHCPSTGDLPWCTGCGLGNDEEPLTLYTDDCPTLRAVAAQYAHCLGYRPEWATC